MVKRKTKQGGGGEIAGVSNLTFSASECIPETVIVFVTIFEFIFHRPGKHIQFRPITSETLSSLGINESLWFLCVTGAYLLLVTRLDLETQYCVRANSAL